MFDFFIYILDKDETIFDFFIWEKQSVGFLLTCCLIGVYTRVKGKVYML